MPPSAFPTPDQSLAWFQSAVPPLRVETVETILGRIIADTNVALDPDSPEYLDVVVGSIAHDFYTALSMEFDRVYDFAANEVVRAGIPTLAEGPFLDSWAESLDLERKDQAPATGEVTFNGTGGTIITSGTQIATQAISPESDPIVFEVIEGGILPGSTAETTTLTLPVQALEPGSVGNVLANTVTVLVTNVQPPEGATTSITSVTNAEPMAGGANVESDAALQERVGGAVAGTNGAGNIDDYTGWFLAESGVGHVTVQAAWAGPNTVRVLLTDQNNTPFTSVAFIEALQQKWDPAKDGNGAAQGPIGHIITVATPTGEQVSIAAKVVMEPGWSYDGAGGTRATRTPITEAVRAYIASLQAGEKIILYKVAAAIMDVEGIENLSGLMLGSTATTLATAYSSAEMAIKVASAVGAVVSEEVVVVGEGNTAVGTISSITGTTLTLSAALGHNFPIGASVVYAKAEDLTIPSADVAVLANIVLT